MSSWSHLPNAAHIERVIASVEEHPEAWSDAYIVAAADTAWNSAYNASWDSLALDSLAWDSARNAAFDAAYDAVWDAAWDADWDAAGLLARDAAWDAARNAAYYAARGAILALIAYDDAAKYLTMPSDQLRVWAALSENPAAILLIPAVIAFERTDELEMV